MSKKKTSPQWFPFNWSKRKTPILTPNPHHFVSRNIADPSVLFDGQTHLMMFRGESRHEAPNSCVGRLGVGISQNGVQFECKGDAVLVPDSPLESYGLAHPRLTLAGGVFILTYAAYDGARFRTCLATSSDMVHWFRHGILFAHLEEQGLNCTSAAILPQPTESGEYLMYVGAGDLYLARSKDLIEWKLETKPILTRQKCPDFANKSLEPGPSPFATEHGIVVILNATNQRFQTCVFAALFDAKKPNKCLSSLKKPFLTAEADWERFGYMPNVVRATGLALKNEKFHLYYSGAERCISMASSPVPAGYLLHEHNQAPMTSANGFSTAQESAPVCGVRSTGAPPKPKQAKTAKSKSKSRAKAKK
ncbi:MAG TPA: hypothetical protein EYO33_25640 [Phycisphaerales bacterium]|nr:hypothetical protein [Phycisphaerales bacterium]